MNFLRNALKRFRRPSYFVGRDLQGNSYYERPSLLDDPRPRRSVKYYNSTDLHTYIGGKRRLAVQWSAWLTHTRPDPPSLEELQRDLIRQERLKHNVALLEARDREEIAMQTQMRLQQTRSEEPPPPPPPKVEQPDPLPKPLAQQNKQEGQPEAWSPLTTRRGQ